MAIVIGIILIVYLITNFTHYQALKHAREHDGWWGMFKISISILFHQFAGILVAFLAIIWKFLGL